ncbi:unnamed protein product [Urochloa humidicola]
MALPRELIDDATTEILFRASLVCKPWCRILSDRAFLRRYREFHRSPPLLGFLRRRGGWPGEDGGADVRGPQGGSAGGMQPWSRALAAAEEGRGEVEDDPNMRVPRVSCRKEDIEWLNKGRDG